MRFHGYFTIVLCACDAEILLLSYWVSGYQNLISSRLMSFRKLVLYWVIDVYDYPYSEKKTLHIEFQIYSFSNINKVAITLEYERDNNGHYDKERTFREWTIFHMKSVPSQYLLYIHRFSSWSKLKIYNYMAVLSLKTWHVNRSIDFIQSVIIIILCVIKDVLYNKTSV